MDRFVFIIRFEHKSALESAFSLLSNETRVESCVVEPEALRIRFAAGLKTGVLLLERLYEKGGMTWTERHPLEKTGEGS